MTYQEWKEKYTYIPGQCPYKHNGCAKDKCGGSNSSFTTDRCWGIFKVQKETIKRQKEIKRNMAKKDKAFLRAIEQQLNMAPLYSFIIDDSHIFDIYPRYHWTEDRVIQYWSSFQFLRNLDLDLFENGELY